jgi:hypothetical protein
MGAVFLFTVIEHPAIIIKRCQVRFCHKRDYPSLLTNLREPQMGKSMDWSRVTTQL